MAMASASSSSSRRLTKEQRLFIVQKYYDSGKKIAEVMKAWGSQFDAKCPARGSIDKLIKKYEETGSVDTKKPENQWHLVQLIFEPRLPAAGSKVYQIKIALKDFTPQIWRRVLVPEDFNFLEFSWTVILAMGWRNSHSWAFYVPGFEILKEIYDFVDGDQDNQKLAKDVKLSEVFPKFNCISFEYDHGDSWEHMITLEKTINAEPNKKYPVCLAGKNACPPEDCGGTVGYKELLKTIRDPKNKEHDDMKKWLADCGYPADFDPKRFSPSEVKFEYY